MSDLEVAKRRLREGFSLVIVRAEEIVFETMQSGLNGFLKAIDMFGKEGLESSVVADKIVGRAAAMLCVYCGVRAVYAVVLSDGGKKVLQDQGVSLEFENLVPNILNRQQTGMCPFEKIVAAVSDAEEAYEKLKSCMNN
jgi:hypothetical protein